MSTLQYLSQAHFSHKTVLVRCDLNLPVHDGEVLDTARIKILRPTIDWLLKRHCKIILLSHFKNPTQEDPRYSMRQFIPHLEKIFGHTVAFFDPHKDNPIVLCENLRFHPGEKHNDLAFAKTLAETGEQKRRKRQIVQIF